MTDQRLVALGHVRGHQGDEWNERADTLARIARDAQAEKTIASMAIRTTVGLDAEGKKIASKGFTSHH
jgi:ribonuclease HI